MCYNAAIPRQKEITGLIGSDISIKAWDNQFQSVSGFSFPLIPVLTSENKTEVQVFNWGLIPHWCKDEAKANELRAMTLNAKAETVFDKPAFRGSIGKKRCLVFVNGFYEWRDFNKKKYPYYIHLKDQETFTMGGIYDSWVNKETGEILNTCSIITTEANSLMAKIHNSKQRMPLIFDKETMYEWIIPELSNDKLISLMKPIDEKLMKAHTISKLITSRTENPNVPEVKEEFIYPELTSLK